MSDEQFQAIMAILERIALAVEAQNKPKEVNTSVAHRGSLFGSRFTPATPIDYVGDDVRLTFVKPVADHD